MTSKINLKPEEVGVYAIGGLGENFINHGFPFFTKGSAIL